MNWVFWFLIILLLIGVWIILSCLFNPIGKFTESIVKYVKNNIFGKDSKLENMEEKDNEQ